MSSSSALAALRAHSQPLHDRVDAGYGGFDLADRESYRAFLIAHARALPAAEAVLAADAALPPWQSRRELLAQDLDALGTAMPAPIAFPAAPDGHAGRLGLLYVTEGSRLGGVMLARSVGDGLPRAYLEARHLPGGWRALLAHLDAQAAAGGDRWLAEASAGAEAGFALYLRALAADPASS